MGLIDFSIRLNQASVDQKAKEKENKENKENLSKIFKNLHDCVQNLLRLSLSSLYLNDIITNNDIIYDEQIFDGLCDENGNPITQPKDAVMAEKIFNDLQDLIIDSPKEIEEKRVDAEMSYLLRRDVVYGQALTATILGIATKIASIIANGEKDEEKIALFFNQ